MIMRKEKMDMKVMKERISMMKRERANIMTKIKNVFIVAKRAISDMIVNYMNKNGIICGVEWKAASNYCCGHCVQQQTY